MSQLEITKAELGTLITDPEIPVETVISTLKEVLDITVPRELTNEDSRVNILEYIWDEFERKKSEAVENVDMPTAKREIDSNLNRAEFIKLLIKEGGNTKTSIIDEVHRIYNRDELDKTKARRRVNKVVIGLKDLGSIEENHDKTLTWVGE